MLRYLIVCVAGARTYAGCETAAGARREKSWR
jgi:hypothetical protein